MPVTVYREDQAIGGVNKEVVFQSTKRSHQGLPRASVKSIKISKPPDDLTASDGHQKATFDCGTKGTNNRLKYITIN